MLDDEVLAEYLSERQSKDKGYLAKLRGWIIESVEIFDSMGITEPTAQDYERLRAVLSAKPGQKGETLKTNVVKDRINASKGYFAKKAGRKSMTEQVEVIKSVSDSEQQSEQQPLKRGRKPKPENERRNVKISIYLTGKVYESMKALAALSMQDMSDIFFTLAADFVERNSEKLNAAQDFLANLGAIK